MVKYYTAGSSALAPDSQDDDKFSRRSSFSAIENDKSTKNNNSRTNLQTLDDNQSPHNSRDDSETTNTLSPHSSFHVLNSGRIRNNISRDSLRNAENNALSNNQPSFYRGNGRSENNRKKRGNFLLRRKKGMAGLIISLSLMIGGGFFLGGTNSLLAPAINEVVTEQVDTQYASGLQRYLKITSYQLDNTALDTSVTGKLKYTKMSPTFKNNLERNGITVNGSGTKRTLTFEGETITASDFQRVYNDNVAFREAYTTAKRGRIMGVFDKYATAILNKFSITRNLWDKFKQKNNASVNEQAFNETMTNKLNNGTETSLRTNYGDEDQKPVTTIDPETGQEVPVMTTDPETGQEVPKTETILEKHENNSGTASTSSTSQAKSFLESVTSRIQQVTSFSCTVMQVINMVSIAVAANEIYQSIQFFMGLAENPSKMQMGYGSDSAIMAFLNFMTQSRTTKVEDYAGLKYDGDITEDKDVISLGTDEVTGSPMESQGMIKLMTSMPVSIGLAANYSIERISNNTSTNVKSFHGCNLAKSGTALVSIAVSLIPGIGQVKAVGSFLSKLVLGSIITIGVNAILNFLLPTITKAFFTNPIENAIGIPGGELFAMGAFAMFSRFGRSASSQAFGGANVIHAYNKVNNVVLAQDAEVDRHKRSPFDTTSKNTFLGSIVYNFGTTTSTGFLGKIKNLMRNTSSSISTILGQAHAESNLSYITTFGDCPLLESIGAKGDMYCNAITVTDPSTLDLSPDDDTYLQVVLEQLEPDGEEGYEIKKNGDLAKYINYCDNRDSPPGAVDTNILNSLKSLGTGGDLIINLAGSIPGAGDVLDLIDAGLDEKNMDWATGKKCVIDTAPDSEWNTKFKYYQRFIEDQRILEQMGNFGDSQSLVGAYIEEYEAEHPLDNSPSGILARISGLSKDNAELVLNLAYYYDFLDNYDPSTRIAMDGTTSDTPSGEEVIAKLDYKFRYKDFSENFETDNYASRAIVAEHIIYADVRNRNYAA